MRSFGFERDLRAALPAWLAARLAVGLSLVAAHLIFDHVDPPSPEVARHLREGLLGWDADWYLRIARDGYGGIPAVGRRFFPLLPLLVRPLGVMLGGLFGPALLVVANAGALVFAALLHRLALVETGDETLARRSTWLVAFVPPAFVLVWGYSEGLAGALAVAFFLALRKEAWWMAAAVGVLAGLTRPVGLLLAVPALVEAGRSVRGARLPDLAGRVAAVAGPVAGVAAYLAWVGIRFGDPLRPLTLQQRGVARGRLQDPFRVLWRGLGQLASGDLTGNAVHMPAALLVIVLVVVAARRWPASYAAYAGITVLMALSTTRLGSFERYTLGSFPLVLALATVTARPAAERLALVLGATAMAALGTLALLGGFVP